MSADIDEKKAVFDAIGLITGFVNAAPHRYSAGAAVLAIFFQGLRIREEEKHDLVADMMEFLDGGKPSKESGLSSFPRSRKK